MKSLLHRLTSAIVVAVATLLIGGTPALAMTYDGSDPYSTGCASNSSRINAFTVSWNQGSGTVVTKFSNTCYTAWAEFQCTVPWWSDCTNFEISVQRASDGQTYYWGYCYSFLGCYLGSGARVHTAQLYDGGSQVSRACFYTAYSPICNNWY